jgi:cold shock CspA family protein
VQATVATYDDGQGQVVLDDGTRMPFTPESLAGSGIRALHPGQRVSIQTEGGVVQRLWLPGLQEPAG